MITRFSEWRIDPEVLSIQVGELSTGIESKLGCTKTQTAALARTVEGTVSIYVVPEKRMTECGHMGTDLVGSAGNEMDTETGYFAVLNRFVAGDDLAAARNGMIGNSDLRVFSVFQEEGFADGGRWLHEAFDQADVVFFQRAGAEDFQQDIRSGGIKGEETKTAGLVIEPMTGDRRRGIRGFLVDIGCAEFREGNAAAFIFFHGDTGPLVDQKDIRILVDDVQRVCLEGLHVIDLDGLAGTEQVILPDTDAVCLDIPSVESVTNRLGRKLRQVTAQETVHTPTVRFWRDGKGSHRHRLLQPRGRHGDPARNPFVNIAERKEHIAGCDAREHVIERFDQTRIRYILLGEQNQILHGVFRR